MFKLKVYLTSTLDLLEAYDSVYSILIQNGYTMIAPNARSLKMRINAQDIRKNILSSDAVVFLINGTDANSRFVNYGNYDYDPVETEFETVGIDTPQDLEKAKEALSNTRKAENAKSN